MTITNEEIDLSTAVVALNLLVKAIELIWYVLGGTGDVFRATLCLTAPAVQFSPVKIGDTRAVKPQVAGPAAIWTLK
jgi:hypothetical protein